MVHCQDWFPAAGLGAIARQPGGRAARGDRIRAKRATTAKADPSQGLASKPPPIPPIGDTEAHR